MSISRRTVLAGACGTCAAAVAGCATYGAGSTPASDGGAVPTSASAGGKATPGNDAQPGGLAVTSDIPVGGGIILAAEKVVITQPTKGDFKAFSSTCTHQGCAVSTVEDGEIGCECHGSTFSVEDGSPTGGPASDPLAEMDITVDGDTISMA
ncbi:MAG: Rieske (2Fe-2S) protein [Pseudonocardia sp.]|nr:Rieske (2Fe-2S) protein [Pseudonocardia sp.]